MVRTVFIVGSSSGIGLETVKLFFSKGWNVVAASRNPEQSNALQDLQVQDKKRLLLVTIELTNPGTFLPALQSAIEAYGYIDVLINNAGFNVLGAFELLSQEKLRKQFEVNFFGPAEITRLAIPFLRISARNSNKESLIISIGSGSGHFGIPLFAYYTSSKFAFEGLTEVLHHELSVQNIIVKNVVPFGGVKGTKIGPNSFADAEPLLVRMFTGQESDFSGEEPERRDTLAHYQGYNKTTMPKTMALSDQAEGAKTAAEVAEVVFEAAEDGTKKFRYFVGYDNNPLVKARYGEKSDDEEYMEKTREFFS